MSSTYSFRLSCAVLVTPARPVCSASRGSVASVNLRFDRALRHLLKPAKRTLALTIAHDERRPLRALRTKMHLCGLPEADEKNVLLHHGRRSIASEDDLADLLQRTVARGVAPTLIVTPHDAAALSVPPPPARPTIAEPPMDGPVRLVSFFRFVALDAAARAPLLVALRTLLERLHVRGTVYLAAEGINGQLSVPIDRLDALQAGLDGMAGLDGLTLNVQHESLGLVAADAPTRPYRKLIVREKTQILTDGLSGGQASGRRDTGGAAGAGVAGAALDWQRAGTELDPADWHKMLIARREQAQPQPRALPHTALLLDCRNKYESDAGSFAGAEPLGTDVFSESWSKLRSRLEGVDRSTPIMTFCTGGIRCVKTNAYLEQQLGFTNTYRLRDGIHGYLRHVAEKKADASANGTTPEAAAAASQWRGCNFVFYETEDVP